MKTRDTVCQESHTVSFFSFHSALSAIAAGSFLFSELASRTMTADHILTIKQASSKSFC